MIKIGITGQIGFIGTHLYNFFGLKKDEVIRIPFEDNFFSNEERLEDFVRQCDVIIHLAALNRHNDPVEIYNTNVRLVKTLISALEKTGSTPHVLFSSSIQEERDNPFGKSKRQGRELLSNWAEKNNGSFTGMIIPNVFGPFGNPYYNSVVATFCHQVTHNEHPRIEVDARMRMIYVGDLIKIIWQEIISTKEPRIKRELFIQHTDERNVSEILELVNRFMHEYNNMGIFPVLNNPFERDLFNTFRSYMNIAGTFPVKLKLNTDDRGTFVETIKTGIGGQVSFSTTRPGITRGNHFHTRKIERFAVIKGKARIQLRRIGTTEVLNFDLDGNEPSYVDMPIWYAHNITNTGSEDLYTIFWINEFYDPTDPDTWFEMV